MRCHVEIGGAFRCCLEAVPCDDEGYAIAGTVDGEHRECPHSPQEGSGIKWSATRKAWIAAWRTDG